MTVGPTGTFSTNVAPQIDRNASPGLVAEFREAVGRSTTSGVPSQGNPSSEQAHDTSGSFSFILATRPPINFGNPASNPTGNPVGRHGVPLYDTQGVHINDEETKAAPRMATPKYETNGIVEKLDPEYDADKWDNDEGGQTKLNIKTSTRDPQLENLARSAAHKALLQKGMDGAQADMMVQDSKGDDYRLSVRRNDRDTSVEITPLTRPSKGKDFDTMKNDMAAKGITVGSGFSKDNKEELAAVYDGFAKLKGKDLKAMDGVTLEKGTRKELKGTDENEAAEYGNKKITFFKEAFGPGMIGDLPKAGATFLHEVGHRFDEFTNSNAKFQQTKGSTADITPYDGVSKKLGAQTANQSVQVDPKKEHYAEAFMLYRSDPTFMQQNYPELFTFFEEQTK